LSKRLEKEEAPCLDEKMRHLQRPKQLQKKQFLVFFLHSRRERTLRRRHLQRPNRSKKKQFLLGLLLLLRKRERTLRRRQLQRPKRLKKKLFLLLFLFLPLLVLLLLLRRREKEREWILSYKVWKRVPQSIQV